MICLCNNGSVFCLGSRIEVGSKTDYNNKFVLGILGHMTKMAATTIYGKKPFKYLLLWNHRTDYHQTWYAAFGTRAYHSSFK